MVELLETADVVCIVIYFVAVMIVGLWSTCRPNRGNAAGYFLAGRNMHWFFVGCTIYATNVGAPMFVGLAGTGAASGFAVTVYEWHAVYLLTFFGWIFAPVYVASGAFTMPEYLKKRFGGVRLRVFLSVFSLVFYVLTRISGEIFCGAIFMTQLLGVNLYVAISIILLITGVYTVVGGLAAVIYTDTLQAIFLVLASAVLFIICMVDIGGWNSFLEAYSHAASNLTLSDPQNHSCGLPRSDFMHMWRDSSDAEMPWTGAVFGLTPMAVVYWCIDQTLVQRCLSAKNLSHAKGAALLASGAKFFNFVLFIVPGMISRIYFPDEVACSDPVTCMEVCGNAAGCSNIAYPLLVLRKMPTGLKGIMLSALMAALMSSLTSVFNSASSIFTMDIWRRFRRRARQSELMIVGRISVVSLAALSILWIPILERSQGGQLWTYLQTVSACLTPQWCWMFLLAIFWRRTTEAGAFWGLFISTCVGVIRMFMEFIFLPPLCGSAEEDTRPDILKKVNFLHFAIISSAISIVCTVGISLFTRRRTPDKLHRVTWWTRHDKQHPEEIDSEDDLGIDDDSEDDGVAPRPPPKRTVKRMIYNWVCGRDDRAKLKRTQEEKDMIRQEMTDIHETQTSKAITGAAAIILCTLGAFLLGLFA